MGMCGRQIANDVMREAGVPVVAAWNETLPLWDYHRYLPLSRP